MRQKQPLLRDQLTQRWGSSRMCSILKGQQNASGKNLATWKLPWWAHVYGYQTVKLSLTYPIAHGPTASPRELKDCKKCEMNLREIAYRPCGFQVNPIALGRRMPHVCMNMLCFMESHLSCSSFTLFLPPELPQRPSQLWFGPLRLLPISSLYMPICEE